MELIVPRATLEPAATVVPVRKGMPLVIAIFSAATVIASCLATLQSLTLDAVPSGSPGLLFVQIDEDLCGERGGGFAISRPIPPPENDHFEPFSSFSFTPIVIPIDPRAKADRLFPPLYWGGYGFGLGGVY